MEEVQFVLRGSINLRIFFILIFSCSIIATTLTPLYLCVKIILNVLMGAYIWYLDRVYVRNPKVISLGQDIEGIWWVQINNDKVYNDIVDINISNGNTNSLRSCNIRTIQNIRILKGSIQPNSYCCSWFSILCLQSLQNQKKYLFIPADALSEDEYRMFRFRMMTM